MAHSLTSERLRSFFSPRSIALIGASNKSAWSNIAYSNLSRFGFADRTYLVNRRGDDVHGRPASVRCVDIGEAVDIALVMVPQSGVLEALGDAADAGIRNAVVLSAGYSETGAAGKAAEAEMAAYAEARGMVLLGPNHLGFANFADGIPVLGLPGLPTRSGPVALLSQSGAAATSMLEFANAAAVDLSYLVTLGNEAMIGATSVIDYLIDDERTRAIAIFMEAVRDPEEMIRVARRAAAAGKPIVTLKVGTSQLSTRTAAAHTGALVGDDAATDAVFRSLGIVRVDTFEDLLITANVAARLGRLTRHGIGVVADSGGGCSVIADRAEEIGAYLPEFAGETVAALKEAIPAATPQNPFDMTGAVVSDVGVAGKAVAAVSADPNVGVVLAAGSYPWTATEKDFLIRRADALGSGKGRCPLIYVNQVLTPVDDETRILLDKAGIDVAVPGLSQALVALKSLGWWSTALDDVAMEPRPPELPNALDLPAPERRRSSWSEAAARDLLAAAGIPVVPAIAVNSADEAARAFEALDDTVAIKLLSADILHKSDIGGVRLGVSSSAEARAAFTAVTEAGSRVKGAVIDGALVSPMRSGGIEMLLGVVRDPQWGLILAVALGGIFVEVLKDSVLAPVPVSSTQAATMVKRLRGVAMLEGARKTKPADIAGLADVIARFSELAFALRDDIESIEVNPLRVDGSTIEALDAVITWRNR